LGLGGVRRSGQGDAGPVLPRRPGRALAGHLHGRARPAPGDHERDDDHRGPGGLRCDDDDLQGKEPPVREQGGVLDFIRARGEEFFTRVSNELMSNPRFIKAMQAALRGKEWVDGAVAQALKTLNVPTRTEFKRALARIETLERELADTRREAAAA